MFNSIAACVFTATNNVTDPACWISKVSFHRDRLQVRALSEVINITKVHSFPYLLFSSCALYLTLPQHCVDLQAADHNWELFLVSVVTVTVLQQTGIRSVLLSYQQMCSMAACCLLTVPQKKKVNISLSVKHPRACFLYVDGKAAKDRSVAFSSFSFLD